VSSDPPSFGLLTLTNLRCQTTLYPQDQFASLGDVRSVEASALEFRANIGTRYQLSLAGLVHCYGGCNTHILKD